MSSFSAVTFDNLRPVFGPPSVDPYERAVILQCQGCHDAIVVIEERVGRGPFAPIMTWPTPGSAAVNAAIPDDVAQMFSEAVRCLSVSAPHAAVAMLRSALAQVVQDKGSDTAKSKHALKDQIKQMVADGGLWATFGDWADHIRETGNAGAHPEIFGTVSMEEAMDLRSLVEQVLIFLYVTPAQIARARAGREPAAPS